MTHWVTSLLLLLLVVVAVPELCCQHTALPLFLPHCHLGLWAVRVVHWWVLLLLLLLPL
jgi:hypothetical protein